MRVKIKVGLAVGLMLASLTAFTACGDKAASSETQTPTPGGAIVGGAGRAESANYTLVGTLGEATGTEGASGSASHEQRSGVVGVTQPD